MSVLSSYLLYYFVVISSSLFISFSEQLRNSKFKLLSKCIILFAILIPVLVSGFRYGVGTDYFSYERIYFNLNNSYMSIIELIQNTRYEPGWIILNVFVSKVFNNPVYLFLISALITWVLFFKGVFNQRNNIYIGISVFILLCTIFNLSLNIVRQSLAISFVFLSLTPLLNKKFVRFSVHVLLASCFHYTALMFMPVYWIVNSKYKNIGTLKKAIAPILFISFIVFIDPILSMVSSIDTFSSYGSYKVDDGDFSLGALALRSPIILFILFHGKKLKINQNPISKLIIVYFLGVILLHLGYFGPFISRIAQFYEVTQVLIVSAILREFKNKKEGMIYAYVIVLYYLFWITYHYLMLGRSGTIPFEWSF